MSDQPTDRPDDRPDDRDQPADQPAREATGPAFADTIRAKMEEYEVERHLSDLASTVEHAVRHGVARAGEIAHEHKDDIERLLDRAAGAVDRRTDGKHAERINQVRGSLERGVERIAEQRLGDQGEEPPAPDGPASTPDTPSGG